MTSKDLAVIGQFILALVLLGGCIAIYLLKGTVPDVFTISLATVIGFFYGNNKHATGSTA